jgi:hypothetical protein
MQVQQEAKTDEKRAAALRVISYGLTGTTGRGMVAVVRCVLVNTVVLQLLGGCAPPPHPVDVFVAGKRPVYALYREDSEWLTPSPIDEHSYQISVRDAFQFVVVCVNADGSTVAQELRGTVDEGRSWSMSYGCADDSPVMPGPTVHVAGQMKQPGKVYLDDYQSSTSGPWSFGFDVEPGLHNLIAVGSGTDGRDRIFIQNNLMVEGPTTLPQIDLDTDGVTLDVRRIMLTGADSDTTFVSSVWLSNSTNSTTVLVSDTSASSAGAVIAKVVPTSFLGLTETQTISIDSATASVVRRASATNGATTFAMLATPDVDYEIKANRLSATWISPMNVSGARFTVASSCTILPCSTLSYQQMMVSPGWTQVHGSSALQFDTSSPDFDRSWEIDVTQPYVRALSVWDNSTGVWYETQLHERVVP